MFECVVQRENDWRALNCGEDAGRLYCANPYEGDAILCTGCTGYWSCEDVYNITIEIMAYYDTNGDDSINP